jgi:hypothetical protein
MLRQAPAKGISPFPCVLCSFTFHYGFSFELALTRILHSPRRRYNIPLMNKSFKIMGLFLPSKWGTKMNMVKAVMYGSDKTPTEIFAEEAMNPMVAFPPPPRKAAAGECVFIARVPQGLLGLNKLMLTYGKEEIAQVLRLCANSTNYPIMYHCSSGKDRTGTCTRKRPAP